MPTATGPALPDNGPLHVLSQIIQQVVASAAEAELGALFLNTQMACPICITLDVLGHLQPATPLQTDNSTAYASSMTQSSINAPRPLTCIFIGFMTTHAKANSTFSGALATPIMQIISPNTILPHIIIF